MPSTPPSDGRFYQAADRTAKAVAAGPASRPAAGTTSTTSRARSRSSTGMTPSARTAGAWKNSSTTTAMRPSTTRPPPWPSQLMLRMYLEKKDPVFLAPPRQGDQVHHRRAVRARRRRGRRWLAAALSAQPECDHVHAHAQPAAVAGRRPRGMEDSDYTLHVTFNDDVMGENIKFLTHVRDDARPHGAGLQHHAGHGLPCSACSSPRRQSGWSLQHLSRDTNGRPAGAPAGARSYEPRSLATHTTQTNIQQLFGYFTLTGDKKYLSQLQKAIDWLKSPRSSCPPTRDRQSAARRAATWPTFIELDTNEPLLHPPLRLEHPQRRVLLRQGHHQHDQPLLVGPLSEYRRRCRSAWTQLNAYEPGRRSTRWSPSRR